MYQVWSKGYYGRTDSSITISLRNFVGERIKKTGKGSGHNEKVNKRKTLADFSWLLLNSDIVSYCNIYKKNFDFADRKSLMFIGKIMDRMDTYLPMETQLKRFDG
jgi:hypothetical protein